MDVVAAEAPFRDEQREVGREPPFAAAGGIHHHAGEAGAERQAAQQFAFPGDATGIVQRTEAFQERPRLGERRFRRRVEEGQARRIGDAPGGAVEHQRRQVGGLDLRPGGRPATRPPRPWSQRR